MYSNEGSLALGTGAKMTTTEQLTTEYGHLMTQSDLAKILKRSVEALRVGLTRDTEWSKRVNAARRQFGRRVYYRTADIAALIDGE
jgi:protein involved in temperature-dependent protein secretion